MDWVGRIRPEPGLAFVLPLIAVLTKEPEMLQPDAFCEHTVQQNATVARALARTLLLLGELTARLPTGPLAEGHFGAGRGKREKGEVRGGE